MVSFVKEDLIAALSVVKVCACAQRHQAFISFLAPFSRIELQKK